jgi:hypothetical protein
MSRENNDRKQEDAGYDSDMSLEAYDLSQRPDNEGDSLFLTKEQLNIRPSSEAVPRLTRAPSCELLRLAKGAAAYFCQHTYCA